MTEKENITISEGQYLKHIMDEIPSDVILFKTITGIGATHLELESKRHSIIIEPNVPVIKGKKAKQKKGEEVCAVIDGMYSYNVFTYITDSNIRYKKILVTPESFYKVVEAMEMADIDMKEEYFLLFDECELTTKQVNFREKIVLPMADFFAFKRKAFVSATALTPSDPRFTDEGFRQLTVTPNYCYAKSLQLLITNNVLATLEEEMINKRSSESDIFFIFFNSVKGIGTLINELGIASKSAVFASKTYLTDLEGVTKLAHKSENLDVKKFQKYNFLTSRFYAAVDIDLPDKPHVFILTDLWTAPQNMVDPRTDAVQIVGRFREGVSSITVISNYREDLTYKTDDEVTDYLTKSEECYRMIEGLFHSAESSAAQDAFAEALRLIPFADFINADATTNYFMMDNLRYGERLKSIYTSPEKLKQAYETDNNGLPTKYFDVNSKEDIHPISDWDIDYKSPLLTYKEKVKNIVDKLDWIAAPPDALFVIDGKEFVRKEIRRSHSEIYDAYYLLGRDHLLKIGRSKTEVEKAIKPLETSESETNYPFLRHLQKEFIEGRFYPESVIKREFGRLIQEHEIKLTPSLKNFQLFFTIGPRTSHRPEFEEAKGRWISKSKYKHV